MNIIKRDGNVVPFDREKIGKAIKKAMLKGSGIYLPDLADKIALSVEENFKELDITPSISDVEINVFNELVKADQGYTARCYEEYRAIQKYKRENNTTDDLIMELIDDKNEDLRDDNSNKKTTIMATQRDAIAGIVSKDITRRKILPAHIVQAWDNGVLYYHDSDYSISKGMINCCLINLEDMLKNGTVINDKLIESPKSFCTSCIIATQIIAQISSNQYGGQTITIKHLAPYLRVTYEKMFKHYKSLGYDDYNSEKLAKDFRNKDLKDGVQAIRYQLSTLQTTNGQSPFGTVYLEVEEGDPYEEEMALICEEMLKQRMEGMKNYKGQKIGEAFPKLVYVLDENNCLEGGKYDYLTKLAAKCTSEMLVPDYQSAKIMRQNYEGNNFPPMGCRSHLSPWKDENGNYKWYGRFNQGVVSLNLAQIGIISKGNYEKMWKLLESRANLCKEALLIRHNSMLGCTGDVSPIHFLYGGISRLKPGEKIDKLLKGGYSTLSLGYIGLYELVYAMTGKSHTSKGEPENLALDVMKFLRKKCDEWKEETGLGFSLYGTPAETLCYKFCEIDKKKFGIIPNITDKGFYTNSYHVDVREEIDAFSKLKFESQFHKISSGGCISYIEVPDMKKNLPALEKVINFIYHNVQYAEINTKTDLCYKCGFNGELQLDDSLNWYCPNCGNNNRNEMQVMRRTCGYVGLNFWNKGKTKEISQRVTHL